MDNQKHRHFKDTLITPNRCKHIFQVTINGLSKNASYAVIVIHEINMGLSQPRPQACLRYPSDQRRLGTERYSEFSRQAWQVTSHPKSPRTTGNEAGSRSFPYILTTYKYLARLSQVVK